MVGFRPIRAAETSHSHRWKLTSTKRAPRRVERQMLGIERPRGYCRGDAGGWLCDLQPLVRSQTL